MSYWLCPPHSAPLCIEFRAWQRWGHDMLMYFLLSTPLHRKRHGDFILLVLHFALYHSGQSQVLTGRRVKAFLSFFLSRQLVREPLIAIFILTSVESNPFHSKLLPWHLNLSGRLPVAAPYFFCWKKRKKDPWHVINRAILILKSEWHPLLNNELQIFCYKSLNTAVVWEDSERLTSWFAWALIL